jgi:hypothetical protein
MSKADDAEAVQEFEAKRGVSDPPEERASRSKDSGRRPSAGTSIGDVDEDGDEEEYQTGPKAKVSLIYTAWGVELMRSLLWLLYWISWVIRVIQIRSP